MQLPDGSKPVPKPAVKGREEKRREEPEKPKWTKTERRKMDEKEVEARRREMMENSSWREKERERNKRRHELEMEEERRQQNNKFDEDFARYVRFGLGRGTVCSLFVSFISLEYRLSSLSGVEQGTRP